ncbi:unnamed protein product [Effrenium voratum]|uniref:Uncharacterized protein n=1 Tax=Effrenium voratum TaxID=2562239 RepID=A0AA36MIT6_9DINO|nr:unnamed protein product [Effrenium voratum]
MCDKWPLLKFPDFGMSKGSKGIGNLNNYIQAAVGKIAREGGHSFNKGGKNYTGNQSRQKAEELGLNLSDATYETIAHMPLRKATRLIEEAAQRQSEGEDPNQYIEREALVDDEPEAKRRRV